MFFGFMPIFFYLIASSYWKYAHNRFLVKKMLDNPKKVAQGWHMLDLKEISDRTILSTIVIAFLFQSMLIKVG